MLTFLAALAPISTADMAEARISVALPGSARMVQAGAQADLPQSAERKAWESSGGGIRVLVTYERWRSPQFSPEVILDRYARHDLGLMKGADVEARDVDGHTGALIRVLDPEGGVKFMAVRARSGNESWQVRVESLTGPLDAAKAEEVFASIQISVRPERMGALNEVGLPPVLNGEVQPTPEPELWKPVQIDEAELSFTLPFAVAPASAPQQAADAPYASVRQWSGRRGDMNFSLTRTELKPGFRVNAAAWEAGIIQARAQAGSMPLMTSFKVEGAESEAKAMIFPPASANGESSQIILLIEGGRTWTIQTRAIADEEGSDFHRRVRESLRLNG